MRTLGGPVIWLLALLMAFGHGTVYGRALVIQGPNQLKSLEWAKPGDIVTLKNGNWINAKISVKKGGTAGKPVEIKAESPGGVVLMGASSLEINAPNVIVDGLYFHKGALAQGAVIQFNSHHGIVRNTAIVDYNPAKFETRYYWVYFSGDYNLVDRCYFKGKNNLEPLIGNNLEGSRHNSVLHSYFKDIPFADGNGREILRIWGSGKYNETANDGAFFTIADNLFDHADGEGAEIISLKSNHNQVLRNTIIATCGCINIRRGDFNVIQGNIVLGQGREGAKGLRMSGEHNLVQSNYVSGCEYGIDVSCGEYIARPLTGKYRPDIKKIEKAQRRVPSYPQNRAVTIGENVLVGNSGADIEIGSGYKKHWPEQQDVLLPEACLIRNNRFVRPKGGDSVIGTIPDTSPPLGQFKFQPNQYIGNLIVGGVNAFAASAGGFKVQPCPAEWSEAQEISKFKPLSPADVGPEWLRDKRP